MKMYDYVITLPTGENRQGNVYCNNRTSLSELNKAVSDIYAIGKQTDVQVELKFMEKDLNYVVVPESYS